ncbi:Cd(II)/Pb(II)-responsive transcriptional regulator [Paucibacter sp. O1-1]|uniref:Cd(II)/Pb(II)-responsive transcriptional regulator n=1 Tax=Paucibacter sp. M5-1 TaxID=3015998 RepID=UPI0010F5DB71|nr:Cd(II)/Pb(II)-responsive transcriptional regulator [Paucibacter sp. M5-1]MCU7371278.1 Cd(II)/Pb(II)-responsive transcriptional regulator [Paucibacter sp. O1-1]MCZ7883143.1 Cd(II)/Pb(II)-responsive transcriptional regulator [Paucibacter sp. M5-1]MDA3826267.1 Cd(II)/Pb(II)-responsive transcriptional regulator [Paucibacter sp. O1-1]
MKIGELAVASATQIETIRFYEREGLIPTPGRSAGNYRLYDDSHVQRLIFIRRCRGLDMALDEIRTLLRFIDQPGADCGEVNQVLDDHIGHVAKRIQELRALEVELRDLRSRCQSTSPGQACAILRELNHPQVGELAPRPASDVHTHVGAVHRRKAGVNS